ncbi:major facilitator superfamily protein [Hirsutella rhossiliensis]|uniref:Major facilitator superfamily domain-containing protein n=1 Tax=Hirsutella rhossiliensis TaxID=111463 RepID=A0A9P8MQK0_9HYPO|nr:major facilitator superfamily domain-containing protein [Hirsutella rhossiliensis]KAH0959415.1 major facilitator superfamily domain-containing protein [Hirsutella rhossiliensis]
MDASPRQEKSRATDNGGANKGPRFWLVFAAIALTTFLAALDTSILSTALPTIAAALGSEELYLWITNAYLLASTATIPIFAQAANIYGRRSLTLLAVCLFALGSGLCGGASSTAMMIAGRAVQGIGGGGILTMSEIVICDLVSIRERGLYAGVIGGIWAIAAVVAPILGGAFAQGSSWRWIFYLNLPISGLALALLALFLELHRPPAGPLRDQLARIDWGGSAILIASVASVVLALGWGGTRYPWSSWRVALPLVLGLAGHVAFFAYQAAPWLREPTMPLRIFGNRTSALCLVISFLHSMLLFWACYFLPVYFQAVREASPMRSAVMLFPIATTSAPAGVLAGVFITKTGRYRVWQLLGLGLMSLGCGMCNLLNATSPTGQWVGFQLLLGFGFGFVFTSTLPPILASLAESDVATATGAWTFLRNFGSVWGLAIPGAIFNTYSSNAASRVSNPVVREMLVDGGAYERATKQFMLTLDGSPGLKSEVAQLYVDGLRVMWQASIAFALLAFACALFVPTVELRDELNTEFGLKEGAGSGVLSNDTSDKESP